MALGLTAGFKKKCLNEIKAIKKLGEARPLTEEEVRECNRSAAESVKDRFEKNQVNKPILFSHINVTHIDILYFESLKLVVAFGLP